MIENGSAACGSGADVAADGCLQFGLNSLNNKLKVKANGPYENNFLSRGKKSNRSKHKTMNA